MNGTQAGKHIRGQYLKPMPRPKGEGKGLER